VPRLNDKDTETLRKVLEYSRNAYEEALAAKESSIRIENVINEFIKSHDNSENSNEDSKGYYTKKKHYWYTVNIFIFLDQFVLKYFISNELSMTIVI